MGNRGGIAMVTGQKVDSDKPFEFYVARAKGLEPAREGAYERTMAQRRVQHYFGYIASEKVRLKCVRIHDDGPFTYFHYEATLE